MKKTVYLLQIIFLISSFTIAQDGADDCSQAKINAFTRLNKTNQILYPGDSNIDVTYYKLNLILNYNAKSLSGVVTVKAKSTKNNLQSFYLDLVNSLTVQYVYANGKSLLFTQSNNQLIITTDKTYQSGQEFLVEITYSGFPLS